MATLQDIADKVGCSRTAVSLAMRNSPRISEPVKEKIVKTAKSLSYVPNMAARQLILGKSGLVGVYMADLNLSHTAWATTIEKLLHQFNTNDYKPILGIRDHSQPGSSKQENEQCWLRTFIQLNVDALIILTHNYEDFKIPAELQKKHPIFVGIKIPETDIDSSYITIDRGAGGRMAIEYLRDKGKNNIAVVTAHHMRNLFSTAIKTAGHLGLNVKLHHLRDYSTSSDSLICARDYADYIASLPAADRPDTCFFGDALMASVFINFVVQKGVRVPDDIAVIGYDYSKMAELTSVPLTTIEQPIDAIVDQTAAYIFSVLESPSAVVKKQLILGHRLVERAST